MSVIYFSNIEILRRKLVWSVFTAGKEIKTVDNSAIYSYAVLRRGKINLFALFKFSCQQANHIRGFHEISELLAFLKFQLFLKFLLQVRFTLKCS